MLKKQTTIDDIAKRVNDLAKTVDGLGTMVKRGFGQMATKDDLKHFATKDDVTKAIDDLAGMVKRGFDEMPKKPYIDRQFADINKRLDGIERLILTEHKPRIEHLEIQMKNIKDLLAIK